MTFTELPEGYRFYYTLHPRPTIVLITVCPNGRVNAMPASWNTPVSEEPPTVAIAVDRESYTHECLEHHPEATINVPPASLIDTVYGLGSVSGREVDKPSLFKLSLEPSDTVKPPRWSDAIAVLESSVEGKLGVGEVTLYVFRVLKALVEPGLYTRWGWDFKKTNILLHGAGRAFYMVGRFMKASRKRGGLGKGQ